MRCRACFSVSFSIVASLSCSPARENTETVTAPSAVWSTLRAAFKLAPAQPVAITVAVPALASGALHVEAEKDLWIDVTPRGARDVAAVAVDGMSVFSSALAELDLAYVTEKDRVEELRVAHTRAAAAQSSWSLRLGPRVASVRVRDGHVEVLDQKGAVRLRTDTAYALDAAGTRRELRLGLQGSTLTATLDTTELVTPIAIDPAWTVIAAKPLGGTRIGPLVFKLSSGKIVVAGGSDLANDLRSVEIFDPVAGTWSTAANLPIGASLANMVPVLANSKLLVMPKNCGGVSPCMSGTAYVFDPVAGTSVTSTMPFPTENHTATLLMDGRVVVIGGKTSGVQPTEIRTWNPDNSWTVFTPTGTHPLLEGRSWHAATLLSDGRVFVSGGYSVGGGSDRPRDGAFTYNPSTNALVALPNMPAKRVLHGSFEVRGGPHNGKVIVFGGQLQALDETLMITTSGAVMYDFAASKWTLAPFMKERRGYFNMATLSGGRVLVAGGAEVFGISFTAFDTAELFDPIAFTWRPAGKMAAPRAFHGMGALDGSSAFLVGGARGAKEGFVELVDTAETFKLQALGATCAADGECDSGFCADGVCCNTACTDNCAACDVTGKVGTCSPVTGAPHGTRPACSTETSVCAKTCNGTDTTACQFPPATTACGTNTCVAGVETKANTCDGAGKCKDVPRACGDFVCGADACKTSCAVKADCVNPSHFCESGKCLPQLSNGLNCTSNDACGSGFCVDGICCESKCEGQCEGCDVGGKQGKCVAVKGKPHGSRVACPTDSADACNGKACDGTTTASCAGSIGPCGDYSCDTTELVCKSSCANDADCSGGRECKGGKCVPRSTQCTSDRTEVVASDGVTKTPCTAPYLCRDGVCSDNCLSSGDCRAGFVCDPSQKCVAASAGAAPEDSGGCAMGGQSDAGAGLLAMVLALGLVARRRR